MVTKVVRKNRSPINITPYDHLEETLIPQASKASSDRGALKMAEMPAPSDTSVMELVIQ